MKIEAPSNPPELRSAGVLGSAVMSSNWKCSIRGRIRKAPVKVEYRVGSDSALEDLRLWAQTREYWTLICEYSTRLGWSDGPRFLNGFHSRPLSRLLQSIMVNKVLFQQQSTWLANGIIQDLHSV